jgi:hypothetical protein
MPCASFLMLDGPGGTGCDVQVNSCWDSRDVIVAADILDAFYDIQYMTILGLFSDPGTNTGFYCRNLY